MRESERSNMLSGNAFTVKTWTGEEKPIKKIAFFPETDSEENLFYKIEGQIGSSSFMINYFYDRGKAWDYYMELLVRLIAYLEKSIKEINDQ